MIGAKTIFCPLASGSSGNATLIACGTTRIIVDCGKSGRAIEMAFTALGIDIRTVSALFLTHSHADHVSGAGVLSRRYHLPIHASRGTWEEIERRGGLGKIDQENVRLFDSRSGRVGEFDDLAVDCFPLPHDAAEPVGYRFTNGSASVAIATDIGYVSPEIRQGVGGATVVLLESNHDLEMLKNGSYPWDLKRRILGNFGHLSNDAAGFFASDLVTTGTRRIYLGHLSKENNRPFLAMATVAERLESRKIDPRRDVELILANRDVLSEPTAW